MPWYVWLIIGFFAGANFGVAVMCWMSLAKRSDEMKLWRDYVYEHVKSHPGISAESVAVFLGLDLGATQNNLNSLVKEKLIAQQFGRYWAR